MTAKDRQVIFDKYGGKCAYCGCELKKGWNADHIKPAWHTWKDEEVLQRICKTGKGSNEIENYNPSCPRCNKWKSTYSIEEFRTEISKQVERLKRDSSQFRMALDYNLISISTPEVKFYFEQTTPSSEAIEAGR
jgi:hypothetical protein